MAASQGHGVTPSPLRRMEDPTAEHVMPSKRKPAKTTPGLMPPPAPRSLASVSAVLGKRQILEEDQYLASLETIIERDFFPDLPRLQRQLKWLQTVDPRDAGMAKRMLLSEQRQFGSTPQQQGGRPGTPGGAHWEVPSGSEGGSVMGDDDELEAGVQTNMSLTKFVQQHTSEDNESFQKLLVKSQEEHRQRYFWAYESSEQLGQLEGRRQLLLLPNGERISVQQRAIMDAACEDRPKAGDERSNEVGSWKFRQRNQLMFQPDMEVSRDVCKLSNVGDGTLLLEEGADGSSNLAITTANTRVAKVVHKPKVINSRGTRLPGTVLHSHLGMAGSASPLERPDSQRSSVAELDLMEGVDRPKQDDYESVPMTPVIIPGLGADSPLMTWGAIDGTPMILDPRMTPLLAGMGAADRGPRFAVTQQPNREALAHQLHAKKRSAKTSSTAGTGYSTPLRPGTLLTTGKRAQVLTPAAQALASKLQKTGGATPFGGGLNADHQRDSQSAGRRTLTTPLQSPRIQAASMGRPRQPDANRPSSAALTDGLLIM